MSHSKQYSIMVGMSGGVDSSVAAMLLTQQGHKVQGVFMQNWQAENDPYCTASQDLNDARTVCDRLKIPLQLVNFTNQYWDKVFQYFLDEYAAGRTPNPDIVCNKEIKFNAFLEYALTQGADYIATGHYAVGHKINDLYQLQVCADADKDQTYFLYALNQWQLSKSLFPIGKLTKPQVRQLAQQAGFINHAKKDSTGICFIGERKFKTFLNEYLLAKPGIIETDAGKIIGQHDGLMFYTLGQRKGLKIGGLKTFAQAPWYVVDKDISNNKLIVAQSHDHPKLMATTLTCRQVHWIAGSPAPTPLHCQAKIRYRQPQHSCRVEQQNESVYWVQFSQPQWAITPGQSIVFYQHDNHQQLCLGGGIIDTIVSS